MSADRPQSRAGLVRAAVRKAIPARLMLSAPSGAGKTWTALTIARVLAGDVGSIVVVDTEEESATTYADEFAFEHLPWEPPYSPLDLAATITDLAGSHDVVVVDSMSHFWTGEGGTLDIADGKFGGWKTATPAQDDMVHAILRARSHVIACVREKQAYAQVSRNGRTEIDKLGMEPVQRAGLEYEFNVHATLDMGHHLTIGKTRCRPLAGRTFPPHHADDMAQTYRAWLAGGQPLAAPEVIAGLRERVAALEPKDTRTECRRRFKEQFGDPAMLLEEDAKAAEELVASYEAGRPFEETAS